MSGHAPGTPIIDNGRLTCEATIQVDTTTAPGLLEVRLDGKRLGSLYLTPRGWVPLGAFVLGPGMRTRYFRTPREAATALIKRHTHPTP